ncbi:MAG: hypothetical protein IPK59_20280 [Rhodospirillaceae bacterium]|nr:hypothetical protein [Rhodospirillaceae bacterium]
MQVQDTAIRRLSQNDGWLTTNDQFKGAKTWERARRVLLHPAFYRGFQDAVAGNACNYREFDGWNELDQHRYENGREVAAECRLAGCPLHWPNRQSIPSHLRRHIIQRIRDRKRGASSLYLT